MLNEDENIRFDEKMKYEVMMNKRGKREIMMIERKMKKMKVIVNV